MFGMLAPVRRECSGARYGVRKTKDLVHCRHRNVILRPGIAYNVV
jgi:hypothetical protein